MSRRGRALILCGLLFMVYASSTLGLGFSVLPQTLFFPGTPHRTDADRARIRSCISGQWEAFSFQGGSGRTITAWRVRRPHSQGVAILLHGFGDDGWGPAERLNDLPDMDGVVFTYGNRDLHPEVKSTLGAWEPDDVVGLVKSLETEGVSRSKVLLVGASQGAGVALLALSRLEQTGPPLRGALLESPWKDLRDAGRAHLRGALGSLTPLAYPALEIALWRAGRIAGFSPETVSPFKACQGLKTPVALVTGDRDTITPLEGVEAIASFHKDLTVVKGAGHLQAADRMAGGWRAWADARLQRWDKASGTKP